MPLEPCLRRSQDVVFKKYSLKDRSRGVYVFGIDSIWAMLHAATLIFQGNSTVCTGPTLILGAVGAFFLPPPTFC